MFGDISSFSDEIKICEERLELNSDSLLFARLAQAYLDAGRVDDALRTARKGVAKFPAFAAGHRVLALACHASGLDGECREALEKVVAAIPDDAASQKLLGRLFMDVGDNSSARRAFVTVLEFFPQDAECQLELDKLDRACQTEPAADHVTAGVEVFVATVGHEMVEDEIIEDIEILEMDDSDLLEEEEADELAVTFAGTAPAEHEDPLSTATLAELYVQQGHIDKALEIYRTVSAASHAGRIAELEAMTATTAAAPFASLAKTVDTVIMQPEPSRQPALPAAGRSDAAVATLEGWLENIGRIRACR